MVFGYLDKISEKLGVGAAQIWPWLIRQQYVDFFSVLAFFVLVAPTLFFLARFAIKHWDRDSDGYSISQSDHEVPWGVCLAILSITSLITFLGIFFEAVDLFNIEYAALQDLMKMVNPPQS